MVNLAQLREYLEDKAQHQDDIAVISCDELSALIDTAEAAQDYLRTNWSHNETPAVRRLRETLGRYTPAP
jgi:hypothetical protein